MKSLKTIICFFILICRRSRGQVIDLFTKKSKTCPSDLSVHDLATHPSDNIQLICSSHTVLGLHFKQYNANIVFIF